METTLFARIGLSRDLVEVRRTFDGRLYGQSWETPAVAVPAGAVTPEAVGQMTANFHDAYEQRNGNRFEAFPVQAVTFRIQLVVSAAKVEYPKLEQASDLTPPVAAQVLLRQLYDEDVAAPEYERAQLLAGHEIGGPAVIREETSTTFVPRGRRATVGEFGEISIR